MIRHPAFKGISSKQFLLKKKKIEMLSISSSFYTPAETTTKVLIIIISRFLFGRYSVKVKKNSRINNLIFNFFKLYTSAYVYLSKYNKNLKYSNNLNKLIFRPNFMILKNQYVYVRFPSVDKSKKIKQKRNKIPRHLKLLIFFLFNFIMIKHSIPSIYNSKKNRILVFTNSFNMVLNVLVNSIYI